uniref:Secreted protein n=1 Tax=Picea glauca TaxID=3330 RepID=A0A124GMN9_PICGL|nr:hypothetical protein ABT39_MTgene1774 [Picea glauca]QHR90867.1 hypothetical protein Q903MT_gene4894 [Picea sitchensis]
MRLLLMFYDWPLLAMTVALSRACSNETVMTSCYGNDLLAMTTGSRQGLPARPPSWLLAKRTSYWH